MFREESERGEEGGKEVQSRRRRHFSPSFVLESELTLLETELVGKIDEDVLDLLFRERDVALRGPSRLYASRKRRGLSSASSRLVLPPSPLLPVPSSSRFPLFEVSIYRKESRLT